MQDLFAKLSQLISGKGEKTEDDPLMQRAYAMLLVDVALVDRKFDPRERELVTNVLRAKFNLSSEAIDELIEQAVSSISGMSSTDGFAAYIKDKLELSERQQFFREINGLIAADGVKDNSEVLLKRRIADLLGISSI